MRSWTPSSNASAAGEVSGWAAAALQCHLNRNRHPRSRWNLDVVDDTLIAYRPES